MAQAPFPVRERSPRIASQRPLTSSSGTSPNPDRVMVFTDGKIPRTRSGPPVPTSSSAASMSASSETRSAGRAGDADARELVGLEDLLDAAARDLIAGGRLTIAGHDHAVTVAYREDRRAVHRLADLGGRRDLVARDQVRRLPAEHLEEA